jgi:hypothetical protein
MKGISGYPGTYLGISRMQRPRWDGVAWDVHALHSRREMVEHFDSLCQKEVVNFLQQPSLLTPTNIGAACIHI